MDNIPKDITYVTDRNHAWASTLCIETCSLKLTASW